MIEKGVDKMTGKKKLYKVTNKENGKLLAYFTDSEDLFHMLEWYDDSEIEHNVEEYELVDEW